MAFKFNEEDRAILFGKERGYNTGYYVGHLECPSSDDDSDEQTRGERPANSEQHLNQEDETSDPANMNDDSDEQTRGETSANSEQHLNREDEASDPANTTPIPDEPSTTAGRRGEQHLDREDEASDPANTTPIPEEPSTTASRRGYPDDLVVSDTSSDESQHQTSTPTKKAPDGLRQISIGYFNSDDEEDEIVPQYSSCSPPPGTSLSPIYCAPPSPEPLTANEPDDESDIDGETLDSDMEVYDSNPLDLSNFEIRHPDATYSIASSSSIEANGFEHGDSGSVSNDRSAQSDTEDGDLEDGGSSMKERSGRKRTYDEVSNNSASAESGPEDDDNRATMRSERKRGRWSPHSEEEPSSPAPVDNDSVIIIGSSPIKSPSAVVKAEETDSCSEDEPIPPPPGLTGKEHDHLRYRNEKRGHFVRMYDIKGTECNHCGLHIKGHKYNVMQHKMACSAKIRGIHKTRCEYCGLYGEDRKIHQTTHRELCQQKYYSFDSVKPDPEM